MFSLFGLSVVRVPYFRFFFPRFFPSLQVLLLLLSKFSFTVFSDSLSLYLSWLLGYVPPFLKSLHSGCIPLSVWVILLPCSPGSLSFSTDSLSFSLSLDSLSSCLSFQILPLFCNLSLSKFYFCFSSRYLLLSL